MKAILRRLFGVAPPRDCDCEDCADLAAFAEAEARGDVRIWESECADLQPLADLLLPHESC